MAFDRMRGSRVVQAHPRRSAAEAADRNPGAPVLQAAFHPATKTSHAHLRQQGAWDAKVGAKLPSGSEVVVDRAQQSVVPGTWRSATWSKAVAVAAANWTWDQSAASTYIRDSSVAPITYPRPAPEVPKPRGSMPDPRRHFTEQLGEYVLFDDSASVANAKLVLKNGQRKRLTAGGQFVDLDAVENEQLDFDSARDDLRLTASVILSVRANSAGLQPGLLETDENVQSLQKVMRLEEGESATGAEFGHRRAWTSGVLDRLREGATFAAESVEHWRKWLHPARQGEVGVVSIKLSGSDLHDEGLGAMFVKFNKPVGPLNAKFAAETALTVVIKPEDKSLEKALFGSEATSLANPVNRLGGLDDESISSIRMETSAQHGSLIEFVRGAPADSFDHPQPGSPAMREAMVFAFITGMSDLHDENVLWPEGQPYFIDADNAFNKDRLAFTTKPAARNQSGFVGYSGNPANEQLDKIQNQPDRAQSKLMTTLLATANKQPVITAVRQAFTGKVGRVVPVATNSWAEALKWYTWHPPGTNAGTTSASKWGTAHRQSDKVEWGTPNTPQPGLAGATGIAQAGRFFDQGTEKNQIKADLDQGKIPFYTYHYDSGHVKHNADRWSGTGSPWPSRSRACSTSS